MVPIVKSGASIFLEILFIEYFTIFDRKHFNVITALICIVEKGDMGKADLAYFLIASIICSR